MPAINGFELWLDHGIIALFWRMDEFVESFERKNIIMRTIENENR